MGLPALAIGAMVAGQAISGRQQAKQQRQAAEQAAKDAQNNARAAALQQAQIAERSAAEAAAKLSIDKAEKEMETPDVEANGITPGATARRRQARASFGIDQTSTGAGSASGLRI